MAAQPLCYADQLVVRPLIVPRCTAITAQLALYYLGLGESATTQQNEWAKNAILSAQSIGEQVSWHVLNQDPFKDNGSAIDDATLRGIVETAIQNHFIAPAT
jgi:hypothetical protein